MADSEHEITLGVLTAVEDNHHVTQRSVARELGIALGLANAYLRRCVKKGLIKVQQAPANRYAYYLTPQGFAEKSRLTREYLAQSFRFFRMARLQCGELFGRAAGAGWRRVGLCGPGDLADIATLCAAEHDVEIVGVAQDPAQLGRIDAIMVTDVRSPHESYAAACRRLPAERVLAPALLRLRLAPAAAQEQDSR